MAWQRGKKAGVDLYQRATWHRGLLEPRPVSAAQPEVTQRENDAHAAAVEVMSSLLGCVKDDDLVDGVNKERQVGLYALAHMLADAWRVVTSMPRYNADNVRGLAEVLLKAKPL